MAPGTRIPLTVRTETAGMPDGSAIAHASLLLYGVEADATGWASVQRIPPGRASVFGHRAFCTCCAGRLPVVDALYRLFQERVRRMDHAVTHLVLICRDDLYEDVLTALCKDALIPARYEIRNDGGFTRSY